MSDHDILTEAFRALRETETGVSPDPAGARSRLLAAARARRRRTPAIVRVLAALAAVFLVSTAWAARNGGFTRLTAALFGSSTPSPASITSFSTTLSATAPSTAAPSAPTSASTPVPASAPPFASAPATASAATTASTPTPAALRASTTASPRNREDALYRVAHELHFVRHDPAGALIAWDAYLAAFPKGRFAPEAHYDRALTLIRLGLREEAKAELRPFAEGELGGYRQREARALVDAL